MIMTKMLHRAIEPSLSYFIRSHGSETVLARIEMTIMNSVETNSMIEGKQVQYCDDDHHHLIIQVSNYPKSFK